jgi:PAS domain S-box-containing protein
MNSWRNVIAAALFVIACGVTAISWQYAAEARNDILLQENRTQVFRDMIASTNYGLIVLDPDGLIYEWGPGAERIFGWQATEVLGKDPQFLMPEVFRAPHRYAVGKISHDLSRSLLELNCWAIHKDGSVIPVHFVASSIRNHRGFYHAALFIPGHTPFPPAPHKPVQKTVETP